jgi:DNA-binding transcriptional regulator YdaS (Cro superfamily)
MKLSEYIKAERGNATALAGKLAISLSHLSQIAADSSSTAPARCVLIEQATGGAVTRRDLRPADWHCIWPELIEMKEAPSVPDADTASRLASAGA